MNLGENHSQMQWRWEPPAQSTRICIGLINTRSIDLLRMHYFPNPCTFSEILYTASLFKHQPMWQLNNTRLVRLVKRDLIRIPVVLSHTALLFSPSRRHTGIFFLLKNNEKNLPTNSSAVMPSTITACLDCHVQAQQSSQPALIYLFMHSLCM